MRELPLKTLLWILVALFLPATIALTDIDASLRVPAASGIIAFEFCGFSSTCELVLQQWGERGRQLALLSLGLDYLYLLIYPSLICVCLLLMTRQLSGRWKSMTLAMAWIALTAGFADAVENYCLIQVVLTGSGAIYGLPAGIFSAAKFTVLIASLSWLLSVIALCAIRSGKR